MSAQPKRLIEVDLPIARISAHARREKSIRHGHISTLHIWWARRPLAACRAVICGALWPDPAHEHCPQSFRDAAAHHLVAFAKRVNPEKITDEKRQLQDSLSPESRARWELFAGLSVGRISNPSGQDGRIGNPSYEDKVLDPTDPAHQNVLRFALLDFIADFANWDNSTVAAYLETSRALTQAAHEALGGEPGTRPLVVDPFAGGGSIPLEALRVGADAFASDLNPVAVLLNKVVLEYIPKYGQKLAEEVRKWGQWIKEQAEKELAEFYPKDPDGATPIAYLWARTVRCEGPGCGADLPLIRATDLSEREPLAHLVVSAETPGQVAVHVRSGRQKSSSATVRGGKATCPSCGYTTAADKVKAQMVAKKGGADSARLLCVLVQAPSGRRFRPPTEQDATATNAARSRVCTPARESPDPFATEPINPLRPYKNTVGVCIVTRIGISTFRDLYTARQFLALLAFQRLVTKAVSSYGYDADYRQAIGVLLHFVVDRMVMQNSSLSRWNPLRSNIEGLFSKQALQIVWDFAEANPAGPGMANWDGAVEWVVRVVEHTQSLNGPGVATHSSAAACPLPDAAAEFLFTDPPYFAAIPYADLSDVFYVWLRRGLTGLSNSLLATPLCAKHEELIVTNSSLGPAGETKDAQFFLRGMTASLANGRRIVKGDGLACVVFADASTTAWEAMLSAVIDAGWVMTASWPIDTERQGRTRALGSASLQSSIFMVCRPRDTNPVGDWRDILSELPQRMHEWMPRLANEGVVGADAIFACLGPALEIFSRYSRVEKTNGDVVPLGDVKDEQGRVLVEGYLSHVWAAVSKEALSTIFRDADASGLEPDARLTAMWLWTVGGAAATNGKPSDDGEARDEGAEDEDQGSGKAAAAGGFTLEFDAARKIAQGLGIHLERSESIVEVKGDKARLLSVVERTRHLFGKEAEAQPTGRKKAKKKVQQPSLFDELGEAEESGGGLQELKGPPPGTTALDRLHQAMILFGAQRGELLKRFLVEDGVGKDPRFWKLAQSLAALYPAGTDERRWVEGVLARKKGLGL